MKTIIAGSRTITSAELLAKAIEESRFEITEVIHGAARGVDTMADQWARVNGIRLTVFPAEWHKHGKRAGPIRNKAMAEYADQLIALWDGESRGTANMIYEMQNLRKRTFVRSIAL